MADEIGKVGWVDEFFQQRFWFLDWPDGVRVHACTLKVEAQGYLAILKARTAEGPKVAFLGKGSLVSMVRTLESAAGRDALKWRPDKFAFDNLEEK